MFNVCWGGHLTQRFVQLKTNSGKIHGMDVSMQWERYLGWYGMTTKHQVWDRTHDQIQAYQLPYGIAISSFSGAVFG